MIRRSSRALLGLSALMFAVGGSAASEPLEKPVSGPKLLCFKYSTFLLLEGELVTAMSGGPEAISLTVEGPLGTYEVAESEIFAPTAGTRRQVFSTGSTHVYRVAGKRPRYAVYGPTNFSDGKDQLVVWLSGSVLKGTISDEVIYRRLNVRNTDAATVKCEHKFTYSWGSWGL